jgi:hypothetical protein
MVDSARLFVSRAWVCNAWGFPAVWLLPPAFCLSGQFADHFEIDPRIQADIKVVGP